MCVRYGCTNRQRITSYDYCLRLVGLGFLISPLADAQKPEFRNAFMDPIAMSVGVSPDLPEMYPLEGPTFDFGRLMSYPMAPFQYALGAPSGGRGLSGGDLPSVDMEKSKYPYIIKVSTFSVGPLPFGNGINLSLSFVLFHPLKSF